MTKLPGARTPTTTTPRGDSAALDIEPCTGSPQQQWSPPSGGGGDTCSAADLAQGRTATASSQESNAFPASSAVDGDSGTRWSSAFSDPQWLQVDLGGTAG
ncbi:discoidin domain-containing protein [Actinomadura chokoriensis]|uniref:discoidin domain-containing protein n=1 Tax=Actinomadura chokoriensis TaxID=454156 RepID=UPI0031F9632D